MNNAIFSLLLYMNVYKKKVFFIGNTQIYDPCNSRRVQGMSLVNVWSVLYWSVLLLQTQQLQNIKQQLHTADDVDIKRILSVADTSINESNIPASPGLWEYRQRLTLPLVQNLLAAMPPEVINGNSNLSWQQILETQWYNFIIICST